MRKPDDVPKSPAAGAQKKKTTKRAAAPGVAKPAANRVAAKPRGKEKAVPPTPAGPRMPDQGTIDRMVAEAAYYLAEKRRFAPGFEEQDWQAAREQIAAELQRAMNPRGPNGR